jgi:hypothetical protein
MTWWQVCVSFLTGFVSSSLAMWQGYKLGQRGR